MPTQQSFANTAQRYWRKMLSPPSLKGMRLIRTSWTLKVAFLLSWFPTLLGLTTQLAQQAWADGKQTKEKIHFDIPATRADMAIIRFAEQADVTFIFPFNNEVRSRQANALTGEYSREEAITKLLEGTGLTPKLEAEGFVTIRVNTKSTSNGEESMTANKKGFLAGLIAALTLQGADASAQSAPTGEQGQNRVLDEIVVMARKREESIQDVALSITALSGIAITNKGLVSALDLTKVSPNLTTNSAYGDTQPNYAMRGISVANEFNPNQASPIGVYVNESYMSNRISHGMALFDIERVEVLRGPQGTLYGRNTTGGAISIFTRQPELDEGLSGYVQGGIGNKNRWEAEGALDATLNTQQTLGARLAFNLAESDGLIRNHVPRAKDSNSTDSKMARLSLRFNPNDDLDALLMVYGGRNKPTSSAVYPFGVNPSTGETTPGSVNPYTGYSRKHLSFFATEMEEAGYYETEGSGAQLRVQWHPTDALTLTSITSYDEGSQDLDFDADGTPVDLLTDKWKADFEQFNQELRVFAELSETVDLTAGIYYGKDEVHTDYYNRFFGFAPLMFETTVDSLQKRDSTAVFGDMDWRINDRLKLSAGLRWTRDSIQVTDYFATYAGAVTIGPDYRTPKKTLSEVTGRLAADYQFTDNIMGYASYSRGYRSGAYNASTSSGLHSLTYVQPEFVDAYEIGLKTQSDDRRVTLNTALFYNDYKDQQLQELVDAVSYLRNAGKSTLQGAEVELNYVLTPAVVLSASLGYLDAEYDKLTLAGLNLSGNSLPFAPELTGNIGVDWDIAHISGVDISLFVNASYVDDQYFSPFNEHAGNQNLQQNSYWTVDGNLRFDTGTLYGSLWVRNLFDDEHFVYGMDVKALGYSYMVQNAPRTFGARIGLRF